MIAAFLLQDLAFANPDLKPILWNKPEDHKPWARKFLPEIPESVAVLEDAWKSSDAGKTLILIQDAHTNPSGQINLSKTLDLILQKAPVKNVFLEAGSGDASLSFLRAHAPLEKRKRIGMAYLRKGELQGSEYLNLTSDRDFALWGVEDPGLYANALETYRQVAKHRDQFEHYLNRVENTIKVLKPRIYNPLLLDFDEKFRKVQKDQIPLTDHYQFLSDEARRLEIDLSSFRNLRVFRRLRSLEQRIDFKKAGEEQARAVRSLSPGAQKELLEMRDPAKISRDNKVLAAYFAFLKEKLSSTKNYPELFKYFAYLKASKKIDFKKLLEEQRELEKEIFKALSVNEEESILIASSRNVQALKKLLYLQFTPDEWKEYLEDKKAFELTRITGFLNRKLMDLKQFYEDVTFLEPGYVEIIAQCEKFYELTYQRDQVFIANLLGKMEARDSIAILVTGGYHAPNLKYLLQKENISYIVLTPQILHETNQKRYERLLLSQNVTTPPAQKDLSAHMLMPKQMAADARGTREFFTQSIAGKGWGELEKAGARLAKSWEGKPTNIVMATPEVFPFEKTGGLADMVSGLSEELVKQGNNGTKASVTVLTPKYKYDKKGKLKDYSRFRDNRGNPIRVERTDITYEVKIGGEVVHGLVDKAQLNGVDYYLFYVEDPERRGYTHHIYDDELGKEASLKQAVFLSRSGLAVIRKLTEKGMIMPPDIVHLHDWQMAFMPVLARIEHHSSPRDPRHDLNDPLSAAKYFFTVHNNFQGEFSQPLFALLNLDRSHAGWFTTKTGGVSLLQGGLRHSDRVHIVSRTYAKELQRPEFAWGFEGIYADLDKAGVLKGIANGMDRGNFTGFTKDQIERGLKAKAKAELQRVFGLEIDAKAPVVSMISRLNDYQKGIGLLIGGSDFKPIEKLVELGVQVIVMGRGEPWAEQALAEIRSNPRLRGRVSIQIQGDPVIETPVVLEEGYEISEADKLIFAGSDLFLVPSRYEPCGLTQLIAMLYGTVPIVSNVGGLKDTVRHFDARWNPEGNGYIFEDMTPFALYSMIRWAAGVYRERPEEWRRLVANGLDSDNSWFSRMAEFGDLYKSPFTEEVHFLRDQALQSRDRALNERILEKLSAVSGRYPFLAHEVTEAQTVVNEHMRRNTGARLAVKSVADAVRVPVWKHGGLVFDLDGTLRALSSASDPDWHERRIHERLAYLLEKGLPVSIMTFSQPREAIQSAGDPLLKKLGAGSEALGRFAIYANDGKGGAVRVVADGDGGWHQESLPFKADQKDKILAWHLRKEKLIRSRVVYVSDDYSFIDRPVLRVAGITRVNVNFDPRVSYPGTVRGREGPAGALEILDGFVVGEEELSRRTRFEDHLSRLDSVPLNVSGEGPVSVAERVTEGPKWFIIRLHPSRMDDPKLYKSTGVWLHLFASYVADQFREKGALPIGSDLDFVLSEVLKNAFRHGSKLNFALPIAMRFHRDDQGGLSRVDVLDAASLVELDPQTKEAARASNLGGENHFLRHVHEKHHYWSYRREKILENGEVAGSRVILEVKLDPRQGARLAVSDKFSRDLKFAMLALESASIVEISELRKARILRIKELIRRFVEVKGEYKDFREAVDELSLIIGNGNDKRAASEHLQAAGDIIRFSRIGQKVDPGILAGVLLGSIHEKYLPMEMKGWRGSPEILQNLANALTVYRQRNTNDEKTQRELVEQLTTIREEDIRPLYIDLSREVPRREDTLLAVADLIGLIHSLQHQLIVYQHASMDEYDREVLDMIGRNELHEKNVTSELLKEWGDRYKTKAVPSEVMLLLARAAESATRPKAEPNEVSQAAAETLAALFGALFVHEQNNFLGYLYYQGVQKDRGAYVFAAHYLEPRKGMEGTNFVVYPPLEGETAPEGSRLAATRLIVSKVDLEKLRSGHIFPRGGELLHHSAWSLVLELKGGATPLVIKQPLRPKALEKPTSDWIFDHQVRAARAIRSLGVEKVDGYYGPSNLLAGFEYQPEDTHRRGLIMPRLFGETASKRFFSGPEYEGASLPPHNKHFESVLHYLETARAMAEATALFNSLGWVHEDLKPENFFVEGPRNGRKQTIILYDFDTSRALGESSPNQMGTLGFMSSEQVAGFPASLKDDVHGLSATLAWLWSGQLLYNSEGRTNVEGKRVREQNMSGSSIWVYFERALEGNPLKDVILSGLNKPGTKPCASVSEMLKDIQAAIDQTSGARLAAHPVAIVIDDHPAKLNRAAGHFAASGYRVEKVGNLSQAIGLFKRVKAQGWPVAWVVSDMDLSGNSFWRKYQALDGFWLIKRARREFPKAKTLLYTSLLNRRTDKGLIHAIRRWFLKKLSRHFGIEVRAKEELEGEWQKEVGAAAQVSQLIGDIWEGIPEGIRNDPFRPECQAAYAGILAASDKINPAEWTYFRLEDIYRIFWSELFSRGNYPRVLEWFRRIASLPESDPGPRTLLGDGSLTHIRALYYLAKIMDRESVKALVKYKGTGRSFIEVFGAELGPNIHPHPKITSGYLLRLLADLSQFYREEGRFDEALRVWDNFAALCIHEKTLITGYSLDSDSFLRIREDILKEKAVAEARPRAIIPSGARLANLREIRDRTIRNAQVFDQTRMNDFFDWYERQDPKTLPDVEKKNDKISAGRASRFLVIAGKITGSEKTFIAQAAAYDRAMRDQGTISDEIRRIWGAEAGKTYASPQERLRAEFLAERLLKTTFKPVSKGFRGHVLNIAYERYGRALIEKMRQEQGARLAAQEGQNLPEELTRPLPFPPNDRLLPYEQLPQRVRTKVEAIMAIVHAFQEKYLKIGSDGALKGVTETEYEKAHETAHKMIGQMVVPMLREMVEEGWLTIEERRHYLKLLTDPARATENASLVSAGLMPQYFARYGLHFEVHDIVFRDGFKVLSYEIRPVKAVDTVRMPVEVLNNRVVTARVVRMDKSLVRMPYEVSRLFPVPSAFHSKGVAGEVYMKNDLFTRDLENLLGWHQELLGLKTGEPAPLLKAAHRLFLSSFDSLGIRAGAPRDENFNRLEKALRTANIQHEFLHADAVSRQSVPQGIKDRRGFIEVQGDLSQIIGSPDSRLAVSVIFAQSLREPNLLTGHGSDYVYVTRRIGYHFWKDKKLQAKMGVSLPKLRGLNEDAVVDFNGLPAVIQNAVWDALSAISHEDLKGLALKLWEEIQTPDNPFTKGYEMGLASYEKGTPEGSSSWFLVSSLSLGGLAVLGAGGWILWRRQRLAKERAKGNEPKSPSGARLAKSPSHADVLDGGAWLLVASALLKSDSMAKHRYDHVLEKYPVSHLTAALFVLASASGRRAGFKDIHNRYRHYLGLGHPEEAAALITTASLFLKDKSLGIAEFYYKELVKKVTHEFVAAILTLAAAFEVHQSRGIAESSYREFLSDDSIGDPVVAALLAIPAERRGASVKKVRALFGTYDLAGQPTSVSALLVFAHLLFLPKNAETLEKKHKDFMDYMQYGVLGARLAESGGDFRIPGLEIVVKSDPPLTNAERVEIKKAADLILKSGWLEDFPQAFASLPTWNWNRELMRDARPLKIATALIANANFQATDARLKAALLHEAHLNKEGHDIPSIIYPFSDKRVSPSQLLRFLSNAVMTVALYLKVREKGLLEAFEVSTLEGDMELGDHVIERLKKRDARDVMSNEAKFWFWETEQLWSKVKGARLAAQDKLRTDLSNKFVLLLPGQGVQSVGMGRDMYDRYPEYRGVYERANRVLKSIGSDLDLVDLTFRGPQEKLDRTEFAQIAVTMMSYAVYEVLKTRLGKDLKVGALIGNSTGTLAALMISGAISFEDGIKLAVARGRSSQKVENEKQGKMAGIMGVSLKTVEDLARKHGVQVSNVFGRSARSGKETIFISGYSSRVDKAVEEAKGFRDATTSRVLMNYAAHSDLMKPAAEELEKFLETIRIHAPAISVVGNATGDYLVSAEDVKQELIEDMTHPVLWKASIKTAARNRATQFLEIGTFESPFHLNYVPNAFGGRRTTKRYVRGVSAMESLIQEFKSGARLAEGKLLKVPISLGDVRLSSAKEGSALLKGLLSGGTTGRLGSPIGFGDPFENLGFLKLRLNGDALEMEIVNGGWKPFSIGPEDMLVVSAKGVVIYIPSAEITKRKDLRDFMPSMPKVNAKKLLDLRRPTPNSGARLASHNWLADDDWADRLQRFVRPDVLSFYKRFRKDFEGRGFSSDDLEQKVALLVTERREKLIHAYDPDKGIFEAWLWTVINNYLINILRKQVFPHLTKVSAGEITDYLDSSGKIAQGMDVVDEVSARERGSWDALFEKVIDALVLSDPRRALFREAWRRIASTDDRKEIFEVLSKEANIPLGGIKGTFWDAVRKMFRYFTERQLGVEDLKRSLYVNTPGVSLGLPVVDLDQTEEPKAVKPETKRTAPALSVEPIAAETEVRDSIEAFLVKSFGERGMNKQEAEDLARAFCWMHDESLLQRKPFFQSEDDVKKRFDRGVFDPLAFARTVQEERQKYTELKDGQGRPFFNEKQIHTLLFRHLVPFGWAEQVKQYGFTAGLTVALFKSDRKAPLLKAKEIYESEQARIAETGRKDYLPSSFDKMPSPPGAGARLAETNSESIKEPDVPKLRVEFAELTAGLKANYIETRKVRKRAYYQALIFAPLFGVLMAPLWGVLGDFIDPRLMDDGSPLTVFKAVTGLISMAFGVFGIRWFLPIGGRSYGKLLRERRALLHRVLSLKGEISKFLTDTPDLSSSRLVSAAISKTIQLANLGKERPGFPNMEARAQKLVGRISEYEKALTGSLSFSDALFDTKRYGIYEIAIGNAESRIMDLLLDATENIENAGRDNRIVVRMEQSSIPEALAAIDRFLQLSRRHFNDDDFEDKEDNSSGARLALIESVQKRRRAQLAILDRQKKPIMRKELFAILTKIPRYKELVFDDVQNDTRRDERLKKHPKLSVQSQIVADKKVIQARRDREFAILSRQKTPISQLEVAKKMQAIPAFRDMRFSAVGSDLKYDKRLKNHPMLQPKRYNKKAIEARRRTELAVLNRQKKRITRTELYQQLKKIPGFRRVKDSLVRHDTEHDKRFRNHPKLLVERIDHKDVRARRKAERAILDRQKNPITRRMLYALLKRFRRFAHVRYHAILNDTVLDKKLSEHSKLEVHGKSSSAGARLAKKDDGTEPYDEKKAVKAAERLFANDRTAEKLLKSWGYVIGLNAVKKMIHDLGFYDIPASQYYTLHPDLKFLVRTDGDLLELVLGEMKLNTEHVRGALAAYTLIVGRLVAEGDQEKGGKRIGIEIIALDNGQGIENVRQAVEEKDFTSTGKAGKGKGLKFVRSAAISEGMGYAEFGTSRERYLYRSGVFGEPSPLEPNVSKGTFVKITRFKPPRGARLAVLDKQGDRPVRIHYVAEAMKLLENSNPGVTEKIEKVLATSFSNLTPEDYFRASGRNLTIKLDNPVVMNGKNLGAIKIKGIRFDAGKTDKPYDVIEATRKAGYPVPEGAVQLVDISIDPEGRLVETLRKFVPEGGMLYALAHHEFQIAAEASRKGIDIVYPLAYAMFLNEKTPDGDALGSVVLGIPNADDPRTQDALNWAMGEYSKTAQSENDYHKFLAFVMKVIWTHAKALRLLSQEGFGHMNYHLGQSALMTLEKIFHHDAESVVSRSGLTDKQYFGYVLYSLRNALGPMGKLQRLKFYGEMGIDWPMFFLAAYFEDLEGDSLFSQLDPMTIDAIFRQDRSRPLYEVNHPLVGLLGKVFRLDHGARLAEASKRLPKFAAWCNAEIRKKAEEEKDSEYYREHITKSRELILKGAEGLKGTALLLGLGNGIEYTPEGLERLAGQFDKLIVVDLDEQAVRRTLARLGPLGQKFEVRTADLSGILEDFSVQAAQIFRSSNTAEVALPAINDLIKSKIPEVERVRTAYDADYVVSSLVMSQLGAMLNLYVKGWMISKFGQAGEEAVETDDRYHVLVTELAAALDFKHIEDLKSWVRPQGRVYFSDTTQIFHAFRREDRSVGFNDEFKFMVASGLWEKVESLFDPVAFQSWPWFASPPGRKPGSTGTLYAVEAAILSPKKTAGARLAEKKAAFEVLVTALNEAYFKMEKLDPELIARYTSEIDLEIYDGLIRIAETFDNPYKKDQEARIRGALISINHRVRPIGLNLIFDPELSDAFSLIYLTSGARLAASADEDWQDDDAPRMEKLRRMRKGQIRKKSDEESRFIEEKRKLITRLKEAQALTKADRFDEAEEILRSLVRHGEKILIQSAGSWRPQFLIELNYIHAARAINFSKRAASAYRAWKTARDPQALDKARDLNRRTLESFTSAHENVRRVMELLNERRETNQYWNERLGWLEEQIRFTKKRISATDPRPAAGARLADGAAELSDAELLRKKIEVHLKAEPIRKAVERLVLEIVLNFSKTEWEKPLALALGPYNEDPVTFKIEVNKEETRLDLKVPGLDDPILMIEGNLRQKLEILKREEGRYIHPEGVPPPVHTLLNISKIRMDMTLNEVPAGGYPVGHVIPVTAFGEDPKEAQLKLLIIQLAGAHRIEARRQDRFYLEGLSREQAVSAEKLIDKHKADKYIFLTTPNEDKDFKGMIVRYVPTDTLKAAPFRDDRTLLFPVAGFEADALLGWFEAIPTAGALADAYGTAFDRNSLKIDLDKVDPSSFHMNVFNFYLEKTLNKTLDRAKLKAVLEGRADLEAFRQFSFFLPLARKVPLHQLLQGARMVMSAIGAAA